ncbi:MAG: glutaredoxin family protein [Acidobacteriota bacterium]
MNDTRWPSAKALFAMLTLLLSALSAPIAADVLVLRDGTRVETEGPWEVDRRQVTFVDEHGRFSTLRLDDVDLEASRAATDAASEPQADAREEPVETPPRPQAEPVLTLTNRDVGSAPPDTGPKVIVYVTSWCRVCHITREFLDRLEVKYVEHDIEDDPVARTERDRKFPNCGVPVVDIDGEYLCGHRPKRMLALLKLPVPEGIASPASTDQD